MVVLKVPLISFSSHRKQMPHVLVPHLHPSVQERACQQRHERYNQYIGQQVVEVLIDSIEAMGEGSCGCAQIQSDAKVFHIAGSRLREGYGVW